MSEGGIMKRRLRSNLKDLTDPVRCLGLAVIEQGIHDRDYEWLRRGETLPFWCDIADISLSAIIESVAERLSRKELN